MTKLYVCEISNLIEEVKENEKSLEIYCQKLEKGRIEYIMNHNKAEDRARILGVSLLLLFVLKKAGYELEKLPDFSKLENGKPYLKEYPGLYFNLSHAGNMITCVISDAEVGVDVETYREIKPATIERVFTDKEKKMAGFSKEGYVKLWTIKEAGAKLMGAGLSDIWNGIEILEDENGKYIEKLNQDIRKTSRHQVIAEGCLSDSKQISYYYSVCATNTENPETIQMVWNDLNKDCFV